MNMTERVRCKLVKMGKNIETVDITLRLTIPRGTKVEWFSNVAEQCADIMELLGRKNADYGHDNVTDFEWWGIVVRLNDKFRRIRNLTLKFLKGEQAAVKDETFDDTILDLTCYGLILRMVRGGKW